MLTCLGKRRSEAQDAYYGKAKSDTLFETFDTRKEFRITFDGTTSGAVLSAMLRTLESL